jgi:uncharacterized membrane protein YfcA
VWFAGVVEAPRLPLLLLIGVIGGVLSGAFGVGGGIVMVPLLVTWAGFDQRRASATSLLAILPTSLAASVTYLLHGEVDIAAAALIAAGAIAGSIVGGWLLRRLPIIVLQWAFVALIIVVAVRMLFVEPTRGDAVPLTVWIGVGYIVLGLVMGVCSGLFGIGGGAIAVPALVALFGVSDLVAKGTSLLVMIPTSISGTLTNRRNGLVEWRTGLTVGVAAAVAAIPGAYLALALPPRLSAILFAVFLLLVAGQLAWRAARSRRSAA